MNHAALSRKIMYPKRILSPLPFYYIMLFQVNISMITMIQGAHTGVCSQQHVPSYKNNIDKFKAKGIDSVICVAVNDPYVMNAWAEKLQAKDAVSSVIFFVNLHTGDCLLFGFT